MARVIPCDNGDNNAAVYLVTDLSNGETSGWCAGCWVRLCMAISETALAAEREAEAAADAQAKADAEAAAAELNQPAEYSTAGPDGYSTQDDPNGPTLGEVERRARREHVTEEVAAAEFGDEAGDVSGLASGPSTDE